jgi:hypothetical protein
VIKLSTCTICSEVFLGIEGSCQFDNICHYWFTKIYRAGIESRKLSLEDIQNLEEELADKPLLVHLDYQQPSPLDYYSVSHLLAEMISMK